MINWHKYPDIKPNEYDCVFVAVVNAKLNKRYICESEYGKYDLGDPLSFDVEDNDNAVTHWATEEMLLPEDI